MMNWFKKQFSLTEQGAKNLQKASLYCFLTYCINMGPVTLLLYIANLLLENAGRKAFTPWELIVPALIILFFLYLLLSKEYVCLYNATYKESANLRKNIAETLADLPIAYFSRHDLSDLSESIMSDVERIEHALSHSVPKIVAMFFFFPIMGILMCFSNWKLSLATLLPTIFSFLLVPLSRKLVLQNNQKYYHLLRENAEAFQEHIDLHQEISSFLPDREVKEALFQKMDLQEKLHLKTEMGSFIVMGCSSIFAFLSVATVIFVGFPLYQSGSISILYFLGFIIASMKLKEIFDISKESLMEIFYIAPAVQRISEIKAAKKQEGLSTALSDFSIDFQDVSFSYNEDRTILKDISMSVKEGELFALVGPSGCGKTTILRLLSRLYDAKSGKIFIGGKDLQNTATDSIFQKSP